MFWLGCDLRRVLVSLIWPTCFLAMLHVACVKEVPHEVVMVDEISASGSTALRLSWWMRFLGFVLVSLTLVGVIAVLPDGLFGLTLDFLVCAVIVACITYIFPNRWLFAVATVCTLVGMFTLRIANVQKAELTSFPLTVTDLIIAASSPSNFLWAIGAPLWVQRSVSVVAYAAMAVAGVWIIAVIRKSDWRSMIVGAAGAFLRAACGLIVAALLAQSVIKSVSSYQTTHPDIDLWDGEGLTLFSKHVGILGFLTYSYYFESRQGASFLASSPKVPPPAWGDVEASLKKFVQPDKLDGVLPNIVAIHAESTFDPNDVLHLSTPATNSLFYTHPGEGAFQDTHYRGPGLSNVIGGSSWVTEFEVISGIDSRLFGSAGRFSHYTLSPYARNTFPRYLRDRGYAVSAFSTDDPAFYNSGRAYKLYGFEDFVGGLGPDDATTMKEALAIKPSIPDAPFMKFVLLTENHSPHRCDANHSSEYEPIQFAAEASTEQVCALREYLWRQKRIERAIGQARDFLVQEQARTGRPYVIAIYGDHQPYTFTGGDRKWSLGLDFGKHRKDQSRRKTIIEFISSKDNPLICCGSDPMPLTLFPTMLSAYIADSPNSIYLPENFFRVDHCGSDWIGFLVGMLFYERSEVEASGRTCDKYDSLIAAYQRSGVMSLQGTQDAAESEPFWDALGDTVLSWWSASGRVVIDAAGTRYGGQAPKVEVLADGAPIGELDLAASPDNTHRKIEAVDIYVSSKDTSLEAPACTARLDFRFSNDKRAGEGKNGDRNVYIKSVSMAGTQLSLNQAQIVPAGSGGVYDGVLWIWSNATASVTIPGASGCDRGQGSAG
jgi:hypothetical protein